MSKGDQKEELMFFVAFQPIKHKVNQKTFGEKYLEDLIIVFFKKVDVNGSQ